MDSGWWYIMILESSNPSSFTDPRVRACGVTSKHHTASGRGVFQSTTPSQSVLNQLPSLCESRPHISQHRSFNASQRKSHPTSRRQPAPRPIPVRDPQNLIHPRIQSDFPIQSVRTSSQRQLLQLPYPLLTIRQALLHGKSLSRVHLFPILNPPFWYSLLRLYPLR